jgi:hypothetical protein
MSTCRTTGIWFRRGPFGSAFNCLLTFLLGKSYAFPVGK